MSAYSQSDRDVAIRLVSTLLDQPVTTFSFGYQIGRQGYAPIPQESAPDIYWDDVLDDVQKYREQTAFCEQRGFPILCVEPPLESVRPTPLLLKPEETERLFQPLKPIDNPLSALEAAAQIRFSSSVRLVPYSPTAALGFYKAGLTDFLSVRLAALSRGATRVTRYKFELTTKTSGLIAYWTQAAALQRGNYYGHPTPTVPGTLPAGIYCFGAGLTGGTATYDMTTYFDIPTVDNGYISV